MMAHDRDTAVRFQVLKKGNLPLRPEVVKDDNHWHLIEMMCANDPVQRLRMTSVVERLHELAQQIGQGDSSSIRTSRECKCSRTFMLCWSSKRGWFEPGVVARDLLYFKVGFWK